MQTGALWAYKNHTERGGGGRQLPGAPAREAPHSGSLSAWVWQLWQLSTRFWSSR